MGLENNVPRELKDNICESLGSRKARLLRLVQVEVKADRLDTRVLVLTDFRLLIFTTKVPAKCEHNVHLLDINTLDSKAPNRLLVGSAQKRISVHTLGDTGEVDSILLMLADALYMAFPALKLQELVPSFKVSDDARMLSVLDKVKDSKARHGEPGPCGGFSTAYRCMCDLLNQPVQEEVAWDVDTIYLSQDSHELALQDFDHLDSKLLVPIIAALKHNTWFTKLNATNVKLGMEASTEILTVVKHNKCLEELNLAGVGVKADFVQRLAVALNANSDCQLRALDLSANMVEDKGVMSLCTPLSKLPRGLTQLSLRQAGLSSKGVNRLAEALTANKFASTSLTHLDLSNNVLKADDLSNLYQFLSQPNALTHLNLSGTECALDTLFGPLQRGCLQHLSQLHLAGTCFSYKKSRDMSVPQTWKNFFAMTLALSSVNLSDCKNLLPEAVKNLLLGLSSNPVLEAVSVNLSGCGLGALGAQVLDNCLENLQHVTHLDLSDNSFDTDMKKIIEKMGKNRCIKSLNVGRNFAGIKPKYLGQVLERIVLLIQDENSPVESLSLADSKLRADTTIIINALGANASLREIDVSGNQMGDVGARMLAKALQLNTKLTTVCWDNNVTTAQGFSDIAAALDKNFTLKKMPTPINDAMLALKTQPEKTQAALQKIESLLQRNHSPRKFASDQMYRLQQGFLLSSTQQMVDKLSAQIESLLSSRPTIPAASAEAAKQLLQDAERSRRILPECQKMALQSEGDNREMDQRLRLVGQELQNLVENQVKKNMSSMLDCASSQCPTVMGNTAFAEEVRLACSEHGTVPQNFTEALMVEQVGTDVTNKISEVNLSVAAHLSDKLIDGVLDSLEKTHRKLLSESRGVSGESQLDRDARVSIIRQKSTSSTTSTDTLGESPKLATKKKSLHDRRLRPQSNITTAFDMAEAEIKEIRLDEDRQSVDSLDATDLMVDTDGTGDSLLDSRESTPSSDMSRSRMNRSQEMIAEFDDISPLESGNRLNHLSKNRPKRAKTRAASRAVIQSEAQTIEDIGGMDVDDFFKPSAATNTGSEENQNAINRSVSQESSKTDDTSDKKKGFKAPFGVETKNIAAGISNFFSRKSPKSPEPKPLEVSPSESSHADKRHSPGREMEEKKDEEKEDRSPTGGPKLPPGARAGLPGMAGGLGGGFLSELKNKQRPKSTLIENEAKKDADSVKVSLAPSQPRALVPRSQRESQAPRNTSPGADDKPRPPVKPRPPGVKPKPGPAPAAPTPSARSTMFGGSTSPPKTVSSMRPMSTALPKTPVGGVTTPAANRPTSVRAYLRRFQDPDDDQPDGGSASNKDPSSSPRSSAIKKRGSVRERAQLIDQNSNMDKPSAASTGSTPDSSSILRTKTLNPTASASERSETRSRLVRSLISETTASSRASSGEPPPLPTTLPPGDDDDDSDSCSDEDGGGKPNGRNTDIIYI